ncbi:MAG TPA: serine hydrolase domain-containing protein [Candidatus Hydrogenedentes bacterium]|nr:serine hydrolase domain-containing protein [Candidatus Hydrogenedentota bacterium]
MTLIVTFLACAAAAPPLVYDNVAAFFDKVVPEEMAGAGTPGAVVALVHDGQCVFSKGYGTARRGEDIPIDSAETLFRVASLSKVVCAVAVLQLVEQGRLSLSEDVNRYLSIFRVPGAPAITLDHLLTHTAGFDDRFLGMGAPTPESLIPLGDYLADNLPPRVMPPGKYISYSNHGFALAGHIVECVSGLSFAEYARQRLFEPLGMTHSTFALVPSPDTPLATGYNFYLGKYHEARYDYPETVPASSLATTADDMAKLMCALLGDGAYGGVQLLRPETVRLMFARHFSHHPDLPGRAYAFDENYHGAVRRLEQAGLIWGFVSLLMLMPEERTGLFISGTSDNGRLFHMIRGRFLNRFFPSRSTVPLPRTPSVAETDLRAAAGYYRHNRHCRTTFIKFGMLSPRFVPELLVSVGKKPGTLLLSRTLDRGAPETFHAIGNGCFATVEKSEAGEFVSPQRRMAFEYGADGRSTHMFIADNAYERIRWYETRLALLCGLSASMAVFLATAILWPIQVWRRRDGKEEEPRLLGLVRTFARIVSVLDILFVAGFAVFLLTMDPLVIGYGPPRILIGLLLIPLMSLAPGIVLTFLTIVAWVRPGAGWSARWHGLFATTAAWLFLAELYYWNLLGFQFQ